MVKGKVGFGKICGPGDKRKVGLGLKDVISVILATFVGRFGFMADDLMLEKVLYPD